ncbi:unnamed protein product (macronuclear) [Paramecium tetraurelia]|uniref:Guanylate cyclase domain-containing protein n=1 Tax=Paramecium tetraurelia TaxID=5888 RepID=A0BPH1_PARTE|nr:uncharacterized protein GSPATT00005187001 [Paramecium tetraurelia]CAK60438.1 unnamed protein product [Paramecium tetraurelia]|eukprot:XP_001427836.1 hypothetical protein (macronuclear) [Paramecium tetraurelia strain d4-2]
MQKLTDKQKANSLVKKDQSREEEIENDGKVRKVRSPSSVADLNDLRSYRSPKSVKSARGSNLVINQSGNDEQRKKPPRRLNSTIMARLSKLQNIKQTPTLQKWISLLIEGWIFSIIMAIVTLYALFGDDVRILSVDKTEDDIFFILTIISMSFFSLEIILTSIVNPNYILNFYFFLDVISTATMILDIGWITDLWYGEEGDIGNAATIKALGRASRVARKAARVIRIIRLVRLVKLYKHARLQYEKEQQKKILQQILKQNKLISEENQKQYQQQQQQLQHSQQSQQLNNGTPHQQYLMQRNSSYPSPPPSGRQHFKSNDDGQELNEQQKLVTECKQPYIGQMQQSLVPQNNQIGGSQLSAQSNQQSNQYQANVNAAITLNDQLKSSQISLTNSDNVKESNVGTKLSDLVMRRVITIVLSILISIPALQLDTYQETINSYDSGIFRIAQFKDNYQIVSSLTQQYVGFHQDEIYPILAVFVQRQNVTESSPKLNDSNFEIFNYSQNHNWFQETSYKLDQYRQSDKQYYAAVNSNNILVTCSVADLVEYNKTNAILSIFQTIFVCIVLAGSAVLFNKDVNELVIDPIERMMEKIELIAQNPLEAVYIEEQEDLIMEQLEKDEDDEKIKQKYMERRMETYLLQRLIMKVGALLAVGFGEAGSEIIAENIKKGGSVDPMLPGKKIMAIFGFCDIRNFTDATEVLQQDVMVFVNEIAEIVHSTVDSYGGSANKNIGDAFLLVWKYFPMEYHPDPQYPSKLIVRTEHHIKQKGDMAVLSFLKIITAISISKKLEKYKKHAGLNARMKDYSVKMGFGLHMGWGIEGAIGSSFKIDASYLSPNVNLASRLEAATKQFGSVILISGILKQHLTEQCQKQLRLIDIVTVKGSIEPVEIHTIDMSIKNLIAKTKELHDKFDVTKMNQQEQKQFRVLNRFKRNQLQKDVSKDKINVADQFNTDEEIIHAREPYTKEFYQAWLEGFQFYIKGQWELAQSLFSKTLYMIPDHKDGPSNTLLEVIHSHGGKAPHDWKGYRELTEK